MPENKQAIEIKVIPNNPSPNNPSDGTGGERQRFWNPALRIELPTNNRESLLTDNQRIALFEDRLIRTFGSALYRRLQERFVDSLAIPDALSVEFTQMRRLLERRSTDSNRTKENDTLLEAFISIINLSTNSLAQRRLAHMSSNAFTIQNDRIALLASVSFSTRILSYSSMSLEVMTGGIQNLAKLFGYDFDAFKICFESFIPNVMHEATSDIFAGDMKYEYTYPEAMQEVFKLAKANEEQPKVNPDTPSLMTSDTSPSSLGARVDKTKENVRWVWILSNTSLLMPVLLSLAVLWFISSQIKSLHDESLKANDKYSSMLLEQQKREDERSEKWRQQQIDGMQADKARISKWQEQQDAFVIERVRKAK